MKFYLGTHRPVWLGSLDVPLVVSHRTLAGRRSTYSRASVPSWALDSGGFSELSLYGEWRTTVPEYVEAVERYATEIGRLDWAAPMDWMCEPFITEKTGLTVREHQDRTIANYLELRSQGPFIPVIQGWAIQDYYDCFELYADAGVDLRLEPIVGVGSVCRRQSTGEIAHIFRSLAEEGVSCHGFGVKSLGLSRYGQHLTSSDSLAWSYQARRRPPLPGCHGHKNCANCVRYALQWRDRLMERL